MGEMVEGLEQAADLVERCEVRSVRVRVSALRWRRVGAIAMHETPAFHWGY